MEIHGIIDGVVSMELHGTFPWNSIENVDAGISMEIGVLLIFHGIPWEMS